MSTPKPGVNGPVEPSAAMREFAGNLRQMYVALCEQGFSEQEAFQIVGITIASSFGAGGHQ